MDWVHARSQLAELQAQLRQRRISVGSFAAAVNELQVQDAQGVVWQPDPSGSGWLYWDGRQWKPGLPPPPAPPPGRAAAPVRRGTARPVVRARLLSPERFGEITRNVPLERRPQAWWDVLSLWAGAACGYFWLAYSLVRGMPRLRAIGNAGNSWLDLLPSLALLGLPLLLFIFRRTALPALSRFFNGLRQMPLSHKLGWAVLAALAIWFLQTNNPVFVQREGFDLVTPLLMFAIPLALVWFRSETDRIIMPLYQLLSGVPRIVLTIIGLAAPFLIGFILYNGFGISQYALLRWNVSLGMLFSYAILRTPEGVQPSNARLPASSTASFLFAAAYLFLEALFRAQAALADDFLTDPLNLNDGLRTRGIAPALSGGASSLNTVFVNGVEVARNVKARKPRPWLPHEERMQDTWSGDGRIVSGRGAIDWLKQNKMLDKDGRITKNFRDWLDLLPGDPNSSELEGVYGEFRRGDTDPLSDQITIIVRNPDRPAELELPDFPELDAEDLTIEPTEEDLIVPNDFVEEPHSHNGRGSDYVPPGEPPEEEEEEESGAKPQEEEEVKPEKKKDEEQTAPAAGEEPAQPPQSTKGGGPKEEKDTQAVGPAAWKRLQDLAELLRRMSAETAPGSIPGAATASSGFSMSDPGKWIDRVARWALQQAKDLSPAYKKYVEPVERTYRIDEHDKLPRHLRERGLFDASRESPLSQGVQQAMRNAGASPEYVEAVARKIEADDSQRKRIANLAYDVIDTLKSAAPTHGAYKDWAEQFGRKAGAAAAAGQAAQEFLPPDPTDFVKELCLAQKSRYNSAVDAWRASQGARRFSQTGMGVSNPTTTQDVDKLLRGLQASQRAIKNELGNNMNRIRSDPRMRDLWAEEQALRNLRNETADLNVLQRGMKGR